MLISDFLNGDFKIVSEGDLINSDEITRIKKKKPKWLCNFQGKNIIIHANAFNSIKWAILLDGVANSLLLAPENACEKFIKYVENTTQSDVIIYDENVDNKLWNIDTQQIELIESDVNIPSCLDNISTNWLIATSGTTGTPKIVSHTLESLTRTVSKKNDDTHKIWALMYEPGRFAGIQVIIQALASGGTLLVPNLNNSFSESISFLVSNNCSSLSATPTLWRKILMSPMSDSLNLSQITLGGEIADQKILNTLVKRFPNALITHIYASTEAGVGFSVKDKQAGFPKSWLETGFRGIAFAISSENTLQIKNTCHGQKYIGTTAKLAENDGWIDTGDLVNIIEDRIFFRGRLNGSINIGGNKVIPEEIEAQILSVPDVYQVLVREKKSSIAGALIEALIVTNNDDRQSVIKAVKEHCKSTLPAFKRPAFIKIVDELPTSTTGKIKR